MLAEAEFNIPQAQQVLSANGKVITGDSQTLDKVGLKNNDIILVSSNQSSQQSSSSARSSMPSNSSGSSQDSRLEEVRQSFLNNPMVKAQLQATNPGLYEAAEKDPTKFKQMMQSLLSEQSESQRKKMEEIAKLEANPFDAESQKKIEEMIRAENVQKNMEHALEFNPEVFGTVHMLYINCEVNGKPIKAFVDSGAQMTVMSPKCAEACDIMHLCDKRFSGVAKGVGTSKIIGRVHAATLKLGNDPSADKNLFLQCSFTITQFQDSDMELLIGLDMLKRFQAVLDLQKDVLRIGEFETPFLPESQLPAHARLHIKSPTSASMPPSRNSPQQESASFPEDKIKSLISLGASREQAIASLKATNGNLDMAAGLLFSD